MADANWEQWEIDADVREQDGSAYTRSAYTLPATQEGIDGTHLVMLGELVSKEGIELHNIFLQLIDRLARAKKEYEKAKAAPPGSNQAEDLYKAEYHLNHEIDAFVLVWVHRSKRYGRGHWRRWGRVKVTDRATLNKKIAKHTTLTYEERVLCGAEELSDDE
jgi:hypothetical protein